MYLGAVALMTVLAGYMVRNIVEQGEYRRGLSVAEGVAENPLVGKGFLLKKESLLLPHLQNILSHTQAVFAMALDEQGRVLAHTNVAETGKTYTDSTTKALLASTEPFYRQQQMDDGQVVMDLIFPVWIEGAGTQSEEFLLLGGEAVSNARARVGTLRIGMSLEDALATSKRISQQVFWIITAVSSLVLVMSLFFLNRVAFRIRTLSEATGRLEQGNLGETVVVASQDEIGDLFYRFNQMSQALADTTVSKEYMDNIIQSMNDALIVVLPSGKIETVNQAACDLLGYAKTELIGTSFGSVLMDQEVLNLQSLRDTGLRNLEQIYRTHDGRDLSVLLSVGGLYNKEEQMVGVIYAARDITEQKKAAETQQQLERQLIQSERLASVGTVAAGIVHNLKNPVHVIMGFTQLLETKHPDATEIQRILSAVNQISEMIENILSKSRYKKDPEHIDVNLLLERELDFLRADSVFKTEVETDIQLASDLPSVLCIYTDLSQVFGNLLNNAVEAMYDRSVKQLRVKSCLENGYVVVEVSDTGSGIDAEILPSLFDPFFTTKTGTKDGEPLGTGLGLYMVKQILETYEAKIDVESDRGVGTTFRVLIPMAQNQAPKKGDVFA